MKNILALALLTISSISIASNMNIEFDQSQEITCYNQAKKLGCVSGNNPANLSCVENNKKKLTKECQAMHNSKRLSR